MTGLARGLFSISSATTACVCSRSLFLILRILQRLTESLVHTATNC